MLQKPSDKLHGIQRHDFPFFLLTVFVQKLNDIIFNAFDAIIRDGNPLNLTFACLLLKFPIGYFWIGFY